MTQEFLHELLAEVQRRFYPTVRGEIPQLFHQHRRQLLKALTWPAVWWRQRGFKSEITPARYRGEILTVLDGVAGHGDKVRMNVTGLAQSGFFPAYLLKCIQQHYGHHGEALYERAKPLRDTPVAGEVLGDCVNFEAVLAHTTRNEAAAARQRPRETGLDLDELARAHTLIAPPKRKAKGEATLPLF